MEMVDRKMRPPAKSLQSRDGMVFPKLRHRSRSVGIILFKGEKAFILGMPSKGKTKARGPSSCPRARSMNPMVSEMPGTSSGRGDRSAASEGGSVRGSPRDGPARLRSGLPGAIPSDPGIRGPLHPFLIRCPPSPYRSGYASVGRLAGSGASPLSVHGLFGNGPREAGLLRPHSFGLLRFTNGARPLRTGTFLRTLPPLQRASQLPPLYKGAGIGFAASEGAPFVARRAMGAPRAGGPPLTIRSEACGDHLSH